MGGSVYLARVRLRSERNRQVAAAPDSVSGLTVRDRSGFVGPTGGYGLEERHSARDPMHEEVSIRAHDLPRGVRGDQGPHCRI
jgi:hypothetical protein